MLHLSSEKTLLLFCNCSKHLLKMQTFCDIFYLNILILSNDFVQMVKSYIRTTLNWLVDENITD